MKEKFYIDEYSNFLWLIELPCEFPEGYCFSGGIPFAVKMKDWFNPIQSPDENANREFTLEGEQIQEQRKQIKDYILSKDYIEEGKRYVAITAYGDAIYICKGKSLYQKLSEEMKETQKKAYQEFLDSKK